VKCWSKLFEGKVLRKYLCKGIGIVKEIEKLSLEGNMAERKR